MSADRHQLAKDVFLRGRDLPTSQRSDFYDRACGGDHELRMDVGTLAEHASDETPSILRSVAQPDHPQCEDDAHLQSSRIGEKESEPSADGQPAHDVVSQQPDQPDTTNSSEAAYRAVVMEYRDRFRQIQGPAAPNQPTDSLASPSDQAVAFQTSEYPIGTRIGRNKICRKLDSGGFGTVYEAFDETLGRTVALKVMNCGFSSPDALARFELEARILAHLRHPNIAQVHDFGFHNEGSTRIPFFTMELIPNNKSIVEHCSEGNRSTEEQVRLFIKVCHAVGYAQQKGIMHRDLKPSNILIDLESNPKIIDFGIARAAGLDMAVSIIESEIGFPIGSVKYMSPEQCDADPLNLDSCTDVYSLGIVLFELLTGQFPFGFDGCNRKEAMNIIRYTAPKTLNAINPQFDDDLEMIVFKAIEKDKHRRYRTAGDLGDDLQKFVDGEPVTAHPWSIRYQLQKWMNRNKGFMRASIAVLLTGIIGVVGIVYYAIGERRARAEEWKQKLHALRKAAEADEQRQVAENQAVVLKKVLEFQGKMINSLGESLRMAEAEFRDQPLVQASLFLTVAESQRNLDLFSEAEKSNQRALDIRIKELGEKHADVYIAKDRLGWVLQLQRRWKEAEPFHFQAMMGLREDKTYGPDHDETLNATSNLGAALLHQRRWKEAELYFQDALDGYQKGGRDRRCTLEVMDNLGTALFAQKEYLKAEQYERDALEIGQRVLGPEDSVTVSRIRHNLGSNLMIQKRYAEAVPLLQLSLEGLRRCLGNEHSETKNCKAAFDAAMNHVSANSSQR